MTSRSTGAAGLCYSKHPSASSDPQTKRHPFVLISRTAHGWSVSCYPHTHARGLNIIIVERKVCVFASEKMSGAAE